MSSAKQRIWSGEMECERKPAPLTHLVGDYHELMMRLQAVQHATDRPYAASVAKDAGDAIKALLSRLEDMTTERDNLSSIVANGVDEVAGAALDDAEETIQRLASKGNVLTDAMVEAGARAVASRWGRTAVWEEDGAVAKSVLIAALDTPPQSKLRGTK